MALSPLNVGVLVAAGIITNTPSQGGGGALTRISGLVAGQSLADYLFSRGGPRIARFFAESLRTLAGFPAARPVAAYAASKIYHDGTTQNAEDWTVRLVNSASGGSALLSNSPVSHVGDVIPGGGQGNYWLNAPGTDQSAITLNAADNNSAGGTFTPGPLYRLLMADIDADKAAGRPINFVDWSQGTSDMSSNTTYLANYKAQLIRLFADIRTRVGNPNLPIFINKLGTQYVSTDAGAEPIRQIQREIIAADPNTHTGGEEYPYKRATTLTATGLSFTSGTNTVTVANGGQWDTNGEVRATELPRGTFVSDITGNVLTFQRRVAGVSLASNFTATNAAGSLQKVDNVHLYPGSDGIEPLDGPGGTVNDTTQGFYALASTVARRIAQVLALNSGAVTAALGPYISGASITRGTNVLRVALTHVAGTDFVVGDYNGWRVLVDGAVVNVSSVAKVNATTVDLTLASSIGINTASVSVQYAYGSLARTDQTKFIFDNASPVPFPMQARAALAATIAESANVLTTGAADSYSNLTAAASYTATAKALGAEPTGGGKRHMAVCVLGQASSVSRSVSGVTVAGIVAAAVAGSFKSQANAGATTGTIAQWFLAEVPTGTTGDVVVTFNASMARMAVIVQPIYGLTSTAPYDVATAGSQTATDALPVVIDKLNSGIVLAGALVGDGTNYRFTEASVLPTANAVDAAVSATPAAGNITWAGLTENVDITLTAGTTAPSVLSAVSFSPV